MEEVRPCLLTNILDFQTLFEVVLSISEYEKGKVKYPRCGKGRVRQQITGFVVQTSKKS
jgi:hypothetical protein